MSAVMLFRSLGRSLRQAALLRSGRSPTPAAVLELPALTHLLPSNARSFSFTAPVLQRAADVYSSTASSAPPPGGSTATPGSAHSNPPPPPPGGHRLFDDRSERSGRAARGEESHEEQMARHVRNMYLLSWAILLAVMFDWWNSSVAAGGALLTAHEIRSHFAELMNLIQREDTLLRAEVVALNENTRRSRDELRQELAEARRDMLAVLLSEGRLGGGAGRQLTRLLGGGGGGRVDDNEGGWLSSLAEKTGLRGSSGGRGWDRSDRGGDADSGAWDAGFMSGLRAQLTQLAGGDGGDNKAAGQTQPNVGGEASAVDDRYKAAMGTQWAEGRRDDKREGK